jgi:hypothetical protein
MPGILIPSYENFSNVYATLDLSLPSVTRDSSNNYVISSYYVLMIDKDTKALIYGTESAIPITVTTQSSDIAGSLYQALKDKYPGSTDSIE